MVSNSPKFAEEYSAKIPALTLLSNLGWAFISPDEAKRARRGDLHQVVLRDELRAHLQNHRYQYGGQVYGVTENAIDELIGHVCSPSLNAGLLTANEQLYNHLVYGISVTQFIDGKKTSQTIPLIDWDNPENNRFQFTEEYVVTRSNGQGRRRPDMVCFVNGIPLVVIEAKRPDGKGPMIEEGISQSLRNQRNDEIPQLFVYCQLILAIDGLGGRYGTCQTSAGFYANWREEEMTELAMDAAM